MAVKTIRKKSILPGHKDRPEIIDPGSLKHLLHEERERSNRSGNPFSFLRFTVKESVAAGSIPSGFIRELFDRVRAVDTVGWMEDGGIGVILPYTPASGARILAHELLESPQTGNPPINYTIYTYPFSMFEE